MYFCNWIYLQIILVTTKEMTIRNTLALILCFTYFALPAQDPSDFRKGAVKSRLSIGPVISFYKNHPQHTINTSAKAGFCASYKSEILLGRKISFMVGLDYFNHGFTFRGYYSAPGNTYLFDKTFAYIHEIRVQEVQLPIAFKKAFNYEKDNFYTPYILGGIGARYIIGSYYIITNDSTGTVVYDGKGTMDFEYRLAKGLNAFAHAGLGSQYNFRTSAKAFFVEIIYKYGLVRLNYQGYRESNNLQIKESHIVLSAGLKF